MIAAGFLSPSLRAGGFGPGDLLLSMTPWASYRDQFPAVRGVHNPQLDVIQQYFPWRMYASEQLRQGIVPLHNPHAYCGQPFLANVLSAVLYPPNLLALWMPIGRFFLVSAWLHLTLLGCGMWLLLRAHGLRAEAAMTGAVVAMLNAFVVGWLAYAPISQWTFAWFPWLPYLWLRAYRERRSARLLPCVLVLATMLCGGHLQVAFYGVMAWLLYAGGTLLAERDWRAVGWLLGPLAIGGGLAAPQIVPAYELAFLSGRTSQELSGALGTRVPPLMLGGLLMPYFWGHNALDLFHTGSGGVLGYWGPYINAIEASIGVGAVATGLAVVAVVVRRDRPTALFGAMVAVGVLLALGSPLYTLCYKLIPGFSSLRALARAFAMVDLGLAGLAALGAQSCLDGLGQRERRRAAAVVLAGGLAALLATWLGEMLRSAPDRLTMYARDLQGLGVAYGTRQAIIACAGLAAVALAAGWERGTARALPLLALLELGGLGFGLHRGCPPEVYFFPTPETRWLADAAGARRVIGCDTPGGPASFLDWMPMNTPMAYGLSSPCGSESLTFQAYAKVLRQFWDDQTFTPNFGHRMLNFVGARYLLARERPDGSDAWRRIAGDRCGLWENRAALEPTFATARWWPDDGSAPADRPAAEPTIRGAEPPEEGVTSAGPVSCLVRRLTPQREAATVESPQRLMVVRSTVNGPGWRAWRHGEPVAILPAEGVFQAVAAAPGRSDIRFVYAPSSFRCGVFAALLAAALAAGWVIASGKEGDRE